jgi:hypothetical protein
VLVVIVDTGWQGPHPRSSPAPTQRHR